MKFKNILLITSLLLFVLTISAVSATDDNTTNDLLSIDNISDEKINLEPTNEINQQNEEDNDLQKNMENNTVSLSYTNEDYYSNDEGGVYDSRTATYLYASTMKVEHKSSSYFKIKLLDWENNPVKSKKITLKVWTGKKTKQYTVKTNSKGIAKFNTKNLKPGTHKVKITFKGTSKYSDDTLFSKIIVKKKATSTKKKTTKKTTSKKKTTKKKTTKKTTSKKKTTKKKTTKKKTTKKKTTKKKTTKKKKSNFKSVTIKIKSLNSYFATKKLKTGDYLQTVYSKGGQYSKGAYAEVLSYDYPIHTKIKKVKFYFKNKNTGKIKTKIVKKIRNNKYYSGAKTNLISGYTPYKAKVWYK